MDFHEQNRFERRHYGGLGPVLSMPARVEALRNCFLFLKPLASDWRCPTGITLIPGISITSDRERAKDHKLLYTRDSLNSLLQRCGFRTSWLKYWDESGNFHCEKWDSREGHIN
jgi:hypothetical protein